MKDNIYRATAAKFAALNQDPETQDSEFLAVLPKKVAKKLGVIIGDVLDVFPQLRSGKLTPELADEVAHAFDISAGQAKEVVKTAKNAARKAKSREGLDPRQEARKDLTRLLRAYAQWGGLDTFLADVRDITSAPDEAATPTSEEDETVPAGDAASAS